MPKPESERSGTDTAVTRSWLEAEISRMAGLIDAHGYDVIGFDTAIDAGYPFIIVGDDGRLHWIVTERGRTLEHRVTSDPDELLFWSFESTTRSLASAWELRHRAEGSDFRVRLWAKQAELLHRLNPVWAQRWRRELADRQPKDIDLMPGLPPEGTDSSPEA